ncbi:SDR family oxidoreductase [bacterium]|nr:SDR family oxidoreductase [bacterium]
MNAFKDKVVLVTGAASGIGRATAIAFANEGAKTVLADRDEAGADAAALIRASGGEAIFVRTDVSSAGDVAALFDAIDNAHGRIDIAFNNAGVEAKVGPLADQREEDFDRVIAVNLKGVWLCMKHELPRMLARKAGVVVNCASVAGLVGIAQSSAYVASKHAVVGLTKSAALECAASGVRVNAICPGLIDTPMIDRATGGSDAALKAYLALEPVGRMGTPEEIASAVLWLASDGAAFVTGHALAVDGGWTAA